MKEEKTIFKIPKEKHNEKDLLDIIKNHPEYEMDNRLLLDKIDLKDGTIIINGNTYVENKLYV